jgi:hypothetical protein
MPKRLRPSSTALNIGDNAQKTRGEWHPSKEAMLRIAEDYEHLAEWAEERAKRSA